MKWEAAHTMGFFIKINLKCLWGEFRQNFNFIDGDLFCSRTESHTPYMRREACHKWYTIQ